MENLSPTRSYHVQSILPPPAQGTQGKTVVGKPDNPQQDFLQLMVAQLANVNPDSPPDSTAMLTQYAQMNAALATQRLTEVSTHQGNVATAAMLIDRKVTLTDADGKTTSGQVSAVDYSGQEPMITVDGKDYPLSIVQRVDH